MPRHRTVTLRAADGTLLEQHMSSDDPSSVAAVVCRHADDHPGQDVSVTIRTEYENELTPGAIAALNAQGHRLAAGATPADAASSQPAPLRDPLTTDAAPGAAATSP